MASPSVAPRKPEPLEDCRSAPATRSRHCNNRTGGATMMASAAEGTGRTILRASEQGLQNDVGLGWRRAWLRVRPRQRKWLITVQSALRKTEIINWKRCNP